MKSCVMPS
jgi:hypothetical protein